MSSPVRIKRRQLLALSVATLVAACDSGPPELPAANSADDADALSSTTSSTTLIAAAISRWGSDPFALGSYSYLAPGSDPQDRVALRRPVDNRVYFAGEATSTDYPATVHGALLSGIAAGEEILDQVDDGETVVVIGAGAAGLAAARALHDSGDVEVVVLEGRDRIGGRIDTQDTLGVAIDMGAAWIHGADGNPLSALVRLAEVDTVATDLDNSLVRGANGVEIDEDVLEEQLTSLYDIDVEGFDDVGAVQTEALDRAEPEVRPITRYLVNSEIEHEFAADADQLSTLALEEGAETSGDELTFPGGYRTLFPSLVEDLEIQLERIVTAISHDNAGVSVTLEDGEVVSADRVLVTVPLGVLKAAAIVFDPPLPDDKQRAVDALGMGVLDKIALRFDEVFWDADADVIGYVGEEPGLFAEWFNWTGVVDQPVLIGFNAGSVATRVAAMTDDEITALAMDALRSMYP